MTTYVALLRGINVGGHNKVAMADLRRVVEALGHGDVATYVNSGNVVFTCDGGDDEALGSQLERAVAAELGVRPRVLVRSAAELSQVAAANPFGDEHDPKRVHVVFLESRPGRAGERGAARAQEEAATKGSRDEVRVVDRVAFLHTPDGLGRSVLAPLLDKRLGVTGTARNWSTVTKLLQLCEQR